MGNILIEVLVWAWKYRECTSLLGKNHPLEVRELVFIDGLKRDRVQIKKENFNLYTYL